jgi:hypothetical protein
MTTKVNPKPNNNSTAIIHPPTLPRGKKGSRVTGVLK